MSNTIHDMGGMHGFGPVEVEPNEPVFHEPWEGRVLAMQRSMGYTGLWTIDGGRPSLETLPPVTYLMASYYQRWFLGLEKRVVAYGLVGEDEIKAGHSLRPGRRLNRKLTARRRAETRPARGNFERPAQGPAKFKAGRPGAHPQHQPDDAYPLAALCPRQDRHGRGYPRLPCLSRYRRARRPRARRVALYGGVHGARFVGRGRRPSVKVSIEAFEPYLEPA